MKIDLSRRGVFDDNFEIISVWVYEYKFRGGKEFAPLGANSTL